MDISRDKARQSKEAFECYKQKEKYFHWYKKLLCAKVQKIQNCDRIVIHHWINKQLSKKVYIQLYSTDICQDVRRVFEVLSLMPALKVTDFDGWWTRWWKVVKKQFLQVTIKNISHP